MENIKGLTIIQFNLGKLTCSEFYKYTLLEMHVLKQISETEKNSTAEIETHNEVEEGQQA